MFEDVDFQPNNESIGHEVVQKLEGREIVWLHPAEIAGASNPILFKDIASPFDVAQGLLGDCFLVSALALVASQSRLLQTLIRPSRKKRGCFKVRLWECGCDSVVVVDDLIPCCANQRLPIFARCRDPNQFWVPLVEKAAAKLKGCYAALIGGHIAECLHAFTGSLHKQSIAWVRL